MRNFYKNRFAWDKKYILAVLITLICAVICGIVLYKSAISSNYLTDYAENYVFYVFNFKNSRLLFAHIISDLIYLYVIFFICNFSKLKYFTLVLIFLRGLFFTIYSGILIGINLFGGVIVAIFVYIPSMLISLALCCVVAECCRIINKNYALCMPLVLSIFSCIVYALLINVIFRIIIIIV